MLKFSIVFIFVIHSLCALGDPYANLPGMIPLHPSKKPASDLTYSGENITSREAQLLKQEGLDLSLLNPEESEIWSEENYDNGILSRHGIHLDDSSDQLDILEEGESFELIDFVPTQIGALRLSVRSKKNGETYIIMFGTQVHNVLLRKAILRKLGYYIPPVQFLKSYDVQFQGGFTLSQFLNSGESGKNPTNAIFPSIPFQTSRAPNLWATNIERLVEKSTPEETEASQKIRWQINNPGDLSTNTLRLQDAVIFKSENRMYNLARGYVSKGMIRNRRAFNATFIPLALVESTESVNLFPWEIGKQVNGQLSLKYRGSANFSTTLEDLLWISRKIFHLTRNDFYEIAEQAHLPDEITLLLAEKLISRRNSLRQFLRLDHGTPVPESYRSLYHSSSDLIVKSKISSGQFLVNGKLTKEKWPGYASRFSYGEPDAILSPEEIFAFGKSKTLSNITSNLLTELNQTLFPNINDTIGRATIDHQIDLAVDQFVDYIKTGKASKTSFGFWSVPYATGNLILSREIITGSYLGTDNVVQIADSVGFAAMGGIFIGTHGLPTSVFANGRIEGQLIRKYTRLKPIKSMKRALVEPFENPILPFILQGDLPELFEKYINASPSSEEKEKAQQAIDSFFKKFGESIDVGESLLITDSIGGLAGLTVGYSFEERLRFQVAFEASLRALKRLHIYRRDESTMQIYDDKGHVGAFRIAAGFHSGVLPIFEFDVKWSAGKARTDFYSLNIEPNQKINPDFRKNIKILRDVMFEKDLGSLKAHYSPFILEHEFDQSTSGFSFLVWKRKGLDSSDEITITSPSGFSSDYVSSSTGVRSGRDYQSLAINVINELISYYSESEVIIASTSSGDPGDTIFGHSEVRQITFDAKSTKVQSPYRVQLSQQFSHIQYRWKGWEIDKDGANEILKEINDKVLFPLIPRGTFNETVALQLYRFDLNILLYESAIDKILNSPVSTIRPIFERHGLINESSHDDENSLQQDWDRSSLFYKFDRLRKKYKKQLANGHAKEAAEYGAELISHLEKSLPLPQVIKLVGGAQNLYITANVNGFRKGDDNGDRPVHSNDLGRFGSRKRNGPLNYILSNKKMTASEFYVQWIMEKL